MFHTVQRPGGRKGTGIGLAIVRKNRRAAWRTRLGGRRSRRPRRVPRAVAALNAAAHLWRHPAGPPASPADAPMYPVLFEIFGFPISTFGVMLAIAFLTGTWLVARRMQENWGSIGEGHHGPALRHDRRDRAARSCTSRSTSRCAKASRSRSSCSRARGITFYGGLIGAILACLGRRARTRAIPTNAALSTASAIAAAIGQALGRIGCFLVGDDYGRPTDGWFGIAFPKVHRPPWSTCVRPSSTRPLGSSLSRHSSGRDATGVRDCGPSTSCSRPSGASPSVPAREPARMDGPLGGRAIAPGLLSRFCRRSPELDPRAARTRDRRGLDEESDMPACRRYPRQDPGSGRSGVRLRGLRGRPSPEDRRAGRRADDGALLLLRLEGLALHGGARDDPRSIRVGGRLLDDPGSSSSSSAT